MNYIEKTKYYYKTLGFKYWMNKMLFSVLPIISIRDTRYRTLYWQKKCITKLIKYARNHPDYPINVVNQNLDNKNVWILWLQGMDKMPIIVKKCYDSVNKNIKGYNVVLLAEDNIKEYIHLPDFIVNKFKEGKIPFAQYSDLIRLELLTTYGGIWIDATVYMTEDIPKQIKESEVFFYQASKLEYTMMKISNWFIFSKTNNNYLLKAVRDSLFYYFSLNEKMLNPFIFHLMVTAVYNSDRAYREVFDAMPYICNMNPHLMWFCFNNDYKDTVWENILQTSPLHKLSWKINESDYKDNSICKYILSKEE